MDFDKDYCGHPHLKEEYRIQIEKELQQKLNQFLYCYNTESLKREMLESIKPIIDHYISERILKPGTEFTAGNLTVSDDADDMSNYFAR